MRRGATVLVLSTIILAVAQVHAAPATAEEVERARTFFNAGAQAYAAGKYADAVRSFEQAYALAPRPTVLFSLAQAERKSYFDRGDVGALRRAIDHYGEYLTAVPTGGRRPEAIEAKAELEGRLARVDPKEIAAAAPVKRKPRVTVFSPTPGAQVTIDGGAPSELPYFADLEPGKHKVRVFGDGYFDAEQEISGDKDIDVPVSLALAEKPALVNIALTNRAEVFVDGRLVAETPLARPLEIASGVHVIAVAMNGKKAWSQELTLERAKTMTVEPRLATSTQRYVSVTMLGAGAAALVTSGVFTALALSSESRALELEDKRTSSSLSSEQGDARNDALERRDERRTIALVFGGVGLAAVASGLIMYVFDRPPVALVPPRTEHTPKPAGPVDLASLRPVPLLGPGLYGAGLGATF